MARLWHRNIILKARQLGFTTLIAVLWLDHALFNADQRCVIVAQDREKAEEIFRDKVVFAYERLPAAIRAAVTVQTQNKSEILFSNNSAVRVSTSAHRLSASPQAAELSVNMATAQQNTRRGPKRSAIQPLIGISTASVIR